MKFTVTYIKVVDSKYPTIIYTFHRTVQFYEFTELF